MRGIYKIQNKHNGRIYIGSTENFKSRISRHFEDLKTGVHKNLYLSKDYNEFGEDAFICEMLEESEDTSLLNLERRYIASVDPALLYNIDLEVTPVKVINNGRNKFTKAVSLVKLITKKKYFTESYIKSLARPYRIPYRIIYNTLQTLIKNGSVKDYGEYYETL